MSDPREVFDTNFDYQYAAEQRKSGEKGIVQKLGERAVKWFSDMNKKRKAEKAERGATGSLDTFYQAAEVRERQESLQPRPVNLEPGVYRSNFVGEQPEPEFGAEETDDIMNRAIARARKNLGALPVITMQEAEKPVHDPEDAALLARLEKAFNNPQEPDRSGHVRRATEDDDTLVSTQGK